MTCPQSFEDMQERHEKKDENVERTIPFDVSRMQGIVDSLNMN